MSCACARLSSLRHPLFSPTPNPKPGTASLPGTFPALRALALATCAGAGADARDDAPAPPSSFDFLALKRELETMRRRSLQRRTKG
jgi:hypothetical protein